MRKITPEPVADPVAEARRYVENAETVLREKGKYDPETGCYMDSKYVKAAGHYLWSAMLLILDAVFHVKNKKQPHPDIIDFRMAIGNRDKKLLTLVNVAYQTMHITLGYDGNPRKAICSEGVKLANEIINRCELLMKNAA
jgi:hypothetical protein